jgi:ankyrin repeat protein
VTGLRPMAALTALIITALLTAACAAGASSSPPTGGTTPDAVLIEAASRGDTVAVREQLAKGAPVDARADAGATALVRAAYGNHVDVAALLVQAGADVNLADDTRQSAYLISTSEVGDDPRLLELAVNSGADVNAKDSFNGTGLIRAAERGHARIVERLLEAGIDRDHINHLGYTALHEAIVFGEGGPADQVTVAALVAGGVALDIPDRSGHTALDHAERRGQRAVAAILRAAGSTG